jgi:hypothetical protein
MLAGCATLPWSPDQVTGPSYQPSNVYCAEVTLPGRLKRVAVLPLTVAIQNTEFESGRESLQPELLAELGRKKLFELVVTEPEALARWTGRTRWDGTDPLPLDFFRKVREATGCDAVLFGQLSHYHPYSPLLVGWNLKLVDCQEQKVWWSIDEVFDGSNAMVVNGARRYYLEQRSGRPAFLDSRDILNSPRLFGRYTAKAVVDTLPGR